MAQWRHRINIRQYLTEDESPESMLAAVQGIKGEVAKLTTIDRSEASEALDEMEEAAKAGKIRWFNASLDTLWDWFDANRVWVEFNP